jgi:hypothetical protein
VARERERFLKSKLDAVVGQDDLDPEKHECYKGSKNARGSHARLLE